MTTTDAPEMYVVRIYGPIAGRTALLEEHDFTSGLDAVKLIASHAGTGKRAELDWKP